MKRPLLITSFTLIAFCCFAQHADIVFTDYGSDSTVVGFDNHYFRLDVDFDGEYDFYIENYMGEPDIEDEYIRFCAINDSTDFAYPKGQEPGLGHDTIQVGDSLVHCNNWKHCFDFRWPCNICPEPYDTPWDGFRGYIGTRKKIGNNYYYGWIEFKSYWWFRFNGIWVPTVLLYETAFCTIPNYPLKAGQTCLGWNVEENVPTAFSTVHPNPTDGKFVIRGKDLASAEVFNTLGQHVTTTFGRGETLQIDLDNLPAGLYFVNITDTEGRKHVSKVVKK